MATGADRLPEGFTRQGIRAQRAALLITGIAALFITLLAPLAVLVETPRNRGTTT